MNYEDKYNQTIESIKRIYNQADSYGKELMEKEFPELRESEDERIRKEIIQSIQDNMCVVHKDKCIAWLEKQGEQKPTEWSEDDERNLQGIIDEIEANKSDAPDYDLEAYDRFLSWLKSIKPNHWKPSEEQMKGLNDVIETVPMTCRQQLPLESLYNDLKKL